VNETLVLDASAVVAAVTDRSATGRQIRDLLRGQRRRAPHLVDAEVGNVLRLLVLRGELTATAANQARGLAHRLVHIRHAHHGALASRAWELRENVTFYDALYVALAESLGCPLITLDGRLARALPDHHLIRAL